MAEGILGLGQGQAAGLNSEMLEKLKAVDRRATVDPLEKKLEKFDAEREAITNITSKVDELLEAIKIFSLNQTSGANAFSQKSANVMGEGVLFDAEDVNTLKTGSMRVQVEQLAQKDVWQSGKFDGINTTKDSMVDQGKLTINGKEIDTTGMTYKELATEINKIDGVQASIVEDSKGAFRLSIKSTETGEANKLNLSGNAANELFKANETDPSILKNYHVLEAQDMKMKVDGVEYSSSTNSITIDGLKITAVKEGGDSTIEIDNDNTNLAAFMQNFADKYNDLKMAIEEEIYSMESSIDDKSTLRNMLESIKSELFGQGNSNSSIFSFGFSLNDKNGDLMFNEKEFKAATKNGTTELENLFSGVAEKKGIATIIDEAISISGIKKGLIDYELNMISREDTLKKEKEKAEEALETKYSLMAQQFATYGVMINQMESSFSGLKMMIMQSQSSN